LLGFIQEYYGKHDEAGVAAVKALYAELRLADAYLEYEDATAAAITELIGQVTEVPAAVFTELLGKIYKRSK
jgi:farnesyl diphosphate synthase